MKANIDFIYSQTETPVDHTEMALREWINQIMPEFLQTNLFQGAVTGLYIAAENLGVASSIQLWKSGLENGVAFANPREFPMTLSNSLSNLISEKLAIQGPSYSIVGGEDAFSSALWHSMVDLDAGLISHALVMKVPCILVPNQGDHSLVLLLSKRKNINGKKTDEPRIATLTFQSTVSPTSSQDNPEQYSYTAFAEALYEGKIIKKQYYFEADLENWGFLISDWVEYKTRPDYYFVESPKSG